MSRIIVNKTNFPKSGTTNDVGGMISANKRKNTVRDSRIDIERLTYKENKVQYFFFWFSPQDNFTHGVFLNSRYVRSSIWAKKDKVSAARNPFNLSIQHDYKRKLTKHSNTTKNFLGTININPRVNMKGFPIFTSALKDNTLLYIVDYFQYYFSKHSWVTFKNTIILVND